MYRANLTVNYFVKAGVESKIDLRLQSAITTLGKGHYNYELKLLISLSSCI